MDQATARFGFPFLITAQASKELTHNEALAAIDRLLHCAVEGITSDPSAITTPSSGDMWIVSANPAPNWASKASNLIGWDGYSWISTLPPAGFSCWNKASDSQMVFASGAWVAAAQIAAPTGGGTQDMEARTAIDQILTALKNLGLVQTAP